MEDAPTPLFGRFSRYAVSLYFFDDGAMVACQFGDFKPL